MATQMQVVGQLQPPLCNRHLTETTEKYCRSCKSLVCSLCLMSGKHNDHKIIDYEEFFTKQQRIVKKQLEQVRQIEQPEAELWKELESLKAQTGKGYEDNAKKVSTFMTNVGAGMDAWAGGKVKILEEKKESQLKRLERTLAKIQSIEAESDSSTMEEKIELEADTVYCLIEEPQLDIEKSKIHDTVKRFMPKGFLIPTSASDSDEDECSPEEVVSNLVHSKITSSLPAPTTACFDLPPSSPHSRTSSFGGMSFFSVKTVDTTVSTSFVNYASTQTLIKSQSYCEPQLENAAQPALMPPPREIPVYSIEPMAVISDTALKTSLQDNVLIGDICTSDSGDIIVSDPVSKCIRVVALGESPASNYVTLVKCRPHEPSIVSFNGYSNSKRIVFVDQHSGSLCDLRPPGGTPQKLVCPNIVPGGITTGRSTDGKFRTFVTNLKDSSVVILNSQGKVRGKIELAPLNIQPLSIVFCPSSFAIIVTDLKQRCLHKITLRGEECWGVGQPARQEGIMGHPSGVTVLPNEAIAVADKKEHCITMFAPNGDLLSHIGGPEAGSERASFHAPTAITYCSKRNSLLVLDSENKRIKVLSLQSSVMKQAAGLWE